MNSRPPFPPRDYWYLGSQGDASDELFRRACALAWPYALYCASRYLHDLHAAYDLMDDAVSNAEQYYQRFHGERTSAQLFHRIVSVLKRLSKQRAQNNREIPSGGLSDMELLAKTLSVKPEAEQQTYAAQIYEQMSNRSKMITHWRLEGHTWREIAERLEVNHTAARRTYLKELRGLLFASSEGYKSNQREDKDQK